MAGPGPLKEAYLGPPLDHPPVGQGGDTSLLDKGDVFALGRALSRIGSPAADWMSNRVDGVLAATSNAFNRFSGMIGKALGGDLPPIGPLDLAKYRPQSIFATEVLQSIAGADLMTQLARSLEQSGSRRIAVTRPQLAALFHIHLSLARLPFGEALHRRLQEASTPERSLIIGSQFLALLGLTGCAEFLRDRFTPSPTPSPTVPPTPTLGPDATPTAAISCDIGTSMTIPAIGGVDPQSIDIPKARFEAAHQMVDQWAKDNGLSVVFPELNNGQPTGGKFVDSKYVGLGTVVCAANPDQQDQQDMVGRLVYVSSDLATPLILPDAKQFPDGSLPVLSDTGKMLFVSLQPDEKVVTLGELDQSGQIQENPWVLVAAEKGVVIRSDHDLKATAVTSIKKDFLLMVKDVWRKDGEVWINILIDNTSGWVRLTDTDGTSLLQLSAPAQKKVAETAISAPPTPTLTVEEINQKIVEHFGAKESITTAWGKIVILVGEDGEEKEFLSMSEATEVAGYFDWLVQNVPSALDLLLTEGIQFIKNGRGQFPNRPVGIEINGKKVWGIAVDTDAFFRPQALQDPGKMGGFLQIMVHEAGHVAQLKGDAFGADGCLKEIGPGGSKDPEMDANFVAQLFLDLVRPHYAPDDYAAAIKVQSANTSRPITCVQ